MAAKRYKFAVLAAVIQAVFVALFFVFTAHEVMTESDADIDEAGDNNAPLFQDLVLLTVSAFGLTYCYVSRYHLSSLAFSILITAIGAQWGLLCRGFINSTHYPFKIGIASLAGGLSSAAVLLISWGAVLGKLSPVQLLVLVVVEVPFAVLTEWLAVSVFHTQDVGGSMLCHEFGAYFGLGVSTLLPRRPGPRHRKPRWEDTLTANFRCLIGTVIFWCFWPASVAVSQAGSDQTRVLVNVYVSMLSSCVTSFALSSIMDVDGRFNLGHIQNASIAGGVAIGTAADSMIGPGGALLSGTVGAIVTIFGMTYVQPFLQKYLNIHDTMGVHNLHGLVGIVGGAIGALVLGLSSEEDRKSSVHRQYRSLFMRFNNSDNESDSQLVHGLRRTAAQQAGFQVATLAMCLVLPLFAGMSTGLILRAPVCDGPVGNEVANDVTYWRPLPVLSVGQPLNTVAHGGERHESGIRTVSATSPKETNVISVTPELEG